MTANGAVWNERAYDPPPAKNLNLGGEAIEKRVEDKYRSVRNFAKFVPEYAERNPEIFKAFSRQWVARFIANGQEHLNAVADIRMLNLLVDMLFDGNLETFLAETGFTYSVIEPRPVPIWHEGDVHFKFTSPSKEKPRQRCEYLVVSESTDNVPMLEYGQRVGCTRPQSQSDITNQICVVFHPRQGMQLAIYRDGAFWRANGEPLEGASLEHVIGVVDWVGRRP